MPTFALCRRLFAVFLSLLALAAPARADDDGSASPQPLKIWCVGDSITQGNGWIKAEEQYTYRWHLQKLLHAAGVAYEFVGSKDKGFNPNKTWPEVAPGVPFAPRHDGYWGWKTREVATDAGRTEKNETWKKGAWYALAEGQVDTPDVVLIHLGTNDQSAAERGEDAIRAEVIAPLKTLVTAVREKNPHAKFFIGRLAFNYGKGQAVNAEIDKIPGDGFSTEQSPVVVVKHNEGWNERPDLPQYNVDSPTADTHDWAHPNPQGQKKMAQKWYDAVRESGVPLP